MAVASALANYLVQFHINEWLTYGTFAYAATFLINELTNRTLGSRAARRVVYVGFVVGLPLAFAIAPKRIAVAFGTAFLFSQLMDIAIFSKLRQRAWWVAPGVASILATALDTSTFFTVAFLGTSHSWWRMIIGDFCAKFLIDLGMLGPFRIAMQTLNRSPSAMNAAPAGHSQTAPLGG